MLKIIASQSSVNLFKQGLIFCFRNCNHCRAISAASCNLASFIVWSLSKSKKNNRCILKRVYRYVNYYCRLTILAPKLRSCLQMKYCNFYYTTTFRRERHQFDLDTFHLYYRSTCVENTSADQSYPRSIPHHKHRNFLYRHTYWDYSSRTGTCS